jgi:HD-like signal output (HDOD) protein
VRRKEEVTLSIEAESSQKMVFRKLDGIRDVPTLPAIALRAVEIANDDDSSARELGEFIGRDQALTTKLLSLVNTASYGMSGKVATVGRAVVIMGFSKVRTIILSSATGNIFAGTSDCLDRNRLWLHSVATATAARLLAKFEVGIDPEAAYVAGLLHEVGVVILDRYFHEALRAAVQMAHAQQSTIDKALRDLIGLDQFKVGAYLAQRWQLPAPLAFAIGLHNSPPMSDVNAHIIATVHVASMVADACKMNFEPYAAKKPISANAINLLGITSAKIKTIADELNKQRPNIEEFANMCSR